MNDSSEIKKFNIKIALITALSYVIIAVVFFGIIPQKFHYSLLIIPILLATVTALLHRKLILAGNKRPQKFITIFMAITGIKLLSYLFILLIYILLLTQYAIPFLLIFFVLYIIYTVVEIFSILKYLNTLQN